jgi:hypothetical protein
MNFGKRLDGPGGRRSADREPTLLSAAMLAIGASRTAMVLDVSQTGLRIEVNAQLRVGQDVWLKVHPYDVFGTVAWVEGNLCGVRLDEPFSDDEMAALTSSGKRIWIPRLSREEQLALDEWRKRSDM